MEELSGPDAYHDRNKMQCIISIVLPVAFTTRKYVFWGVRFALR
jgi:hypothetical protein